MARNAGKKEGRVAGVAPPGRKTYYLRKAGTNIVCIRTALLAKRDDMIPISEAEAKKRIAAQKDDAQARVEATRVWREKGGHGQPPMLKQENAERKQQVKEGLVPPEEDENPEAAAETERAPADPLAELDMVELVALANEKKLPVNEDATEDSLRAELAELLAADTQEGTLPGPEAAE